MSSDIGAFKRQIAKYTPEQKVKIREALRDGSLALPAEELQYLQYSWHFWARPEQIVPEGDWTTCMFMCGRGWGKALALDTKIPTPSGWTTMDDLKVGDRVFDESGRQCSVTATFRSTPTEAFRLHFSDDTFIEACGDHQWVTWSHAARKSLLRSRYDDSTSFPTEWPSWLARRKFRGTKAKINEKSLGPNVLTTRDIVDTFTYNRRGDLNHCIPVCGSLQVSHVELPIDPYVLGAWLGDGSSNSAAITIGHNDFVDISSRLSERGIVLREPYPPTETSGNASTYPMGSEGDQKRDRLALAKELRSLGLINNKHIPPIYLRSSVSQRLDLLRGLMDTDGFAHPSKVEIVSVKRKLAYEILELVRSLGQKPVLHEGRASLNGKDCGPKYRIHWRSTINCFAMARKSSRLTFNGSQSLRNHHRMIVRAERIDPKPMKCITVDSPHSMYLAGEGMIPTHNTRTGAEWIREREAAGARRIIIAGPTTGDIRDIIVEGDSGILACYPEADRPKYEPSKNHIQWKSGAVALLISAEESERFRGKQSDTFWCDELASWDAIGTKDVNSPNLALNQIALGHRLGPKYGVTPRGIITTTPKPHPIIRKLRSRKDVIVVTGSTYANKDNLAPSFLKEITEQYENTRLGLQEIHAGLLDETEGALWTGAGIEADRVGVPGRPPEPTVYDADFYVRTVVAIDPAVSSKRSSDETGIIIASLGKDRHVYIRSDLSGRYTPDGWARKAINAYNTVQADRIIAEKNNGGDLVEQNLRTLSRYVPYTAVHASKGKMARAEPVSSVYEQHRVHHVGLLKDLEDQMVNWNPQSGQPSPDRLDAMVWAVTYLMFSSVGSYRSMGTIEAV